MNEALDKVMIGTKRPPISLDKVNRNTAAHEAGHTIVSLYTSGASPLHKVTILPRGHTLGVTYSRVNIVATCTTKTLCHLGLIW